MLITHTIFRLKFIIAAVDDDVVIVVENFMRWSTATIQCCQFKNGKNLQCKYLIVRKGAKKKIKRSQTIFVTFCTFRKSVFPNCVGTVAYGLTLNDIKNVLI